MRQGRLHRRRQTGLGWLGTVAAPWAGGFGLLISFTASAGTDLASTGWRAEPAARLVRTQRHAGLTAGLTLTRVSAAEPLSGLISPGSAVWNPDLESDGFVTAPDSAEGGEAEALEPSDGATPPIPRAVALSSVTPAPAEAVPVEIAAANLALPNFSPRLDRGPALGGETQAGTQTETPTEVPDDARHRYADLIDPEKMDREQRCLAEAVYFEARSEPEEGQAAVAQVVLNRVKSGLYPGNVCGVVYQNRHRYMGCQFSFACEGKSLRISDAGSWASATRIASAVIEGRTYLNEVGGATHYHANYVRPGWSRRLRKRDMIGRHIFYELKRGQT